MISLDKLNIYIGILTGGYAARMGANWMGCLFKKSPLFKRFILKQSALGLILSYRCNQSCNYCKYHTLEKVFPNDMNIELFNKFLDWMEKAGLSSFRVLGGEPTQYPYLKDMIAICKKRKFQFSQFFSNLLFDESVVKYFDKWVFNEIVAHYPPANLYNKNEYGLFISNLKMLISAGYNINVAYMLTTPYEDFRYLIELVKTCRVKKVTLGFTYPGYSDKSIYVPIEEMVNFNDMIVNIVKQLLLLKVKSAIYPALPLCMFKEEERRYLIRNTNLRGLCFGGGFLLLCRINPDLSVFFCPASYQKADKSLLEFRDLDELYEYWVPYIERLRWAPLLESCNTCKYFKNKYCQGGCLSYKVNQKKERT